MNTNVSHFTKQQQTVEFFELQETTIKKSISTYQRIESNKRDKTLLQNLT
jgi:hypothetical protein